jgi:hypothetical protein
MDPILLYFNSNITLTLMGKQYYCLRRGARQCETASTSDNDSPTQNRDMICCAALHKTV